jgi:ABC-type Fe3+-siderophore transport system permease subunit
MNKQQLIKLSGKIKKFDTILKKHINPLIIALLTIMFTPIVVIHFCDAGNRNFELVIGSFLAIMSYFYAYYGKLPKKRWKNIIILIVWLIFVFGITILYFDWIHGSNSPWPSTMRKERKIELRNSV